MRSRSLIFRVAVLFACLAALPVPTFAGTVIERTLAFANKRPVLLSDVALTKALLDVDDDRALDLAIDESLMYDEALRLVNDPPAEDAVLKAVAVLRQKAGPNFTRAALQRKARIQIAIAAYVDLRLRALIRVEDADVRRAYAELSAADPQSPDFDNVSADIRSDLERKALDQKIEEWIQTLRQRADIRRRD